MKIVIDIDDEEYKWIKKYEETVFADVTSKECMLYAIKNGIPLTVYAIENDIPLKVYMAYVIKNGIPLPKGHKIIDATAFVAHTDTGGSDEWDDYACYLVDKEPAIIGSESEE